MKTFYLILASLTVFGTVYGQGFDNLDNPNIPDLPDIDEDKLRKTAEEGKQALKEKCLKVSGSEETFTELEGAKDTLLTCFQGIVNVTAFQMELEDSKKRGAMEEVFGKYCKKKPELLGCVTGFRTTLEKCMEEKEKDTMKIAMNLTESLLEFMCYKDGDRIAMFIAEGGFECIESMKNEIQACVNETFVEVAPKNLDFQNIGDLMLIDDKKCDDFTKLQNCVTKKLEGCANQTPANVIDSLFKYIKKNLPCSPTTPPGSGPETRLVDFNRLKRQASFTNGLEKKCKMNGSPTAYEDLKISFTNFQNCAVNNLFRGNPDNCPQIRRTIEICADEFYPKLRQCLLAKEDEFFIQFLKDAIKAVLEYACKDNGLNLRDFLQTEGLKCINNSESSHNFKGCLERADRHKTENDQVIIEKDALCKDLDNIRMCTVKHIGSSNCGKHARFVELVDGFMGALHSPCSASSMYFVNLTLLFTVLCYHFKKYFD